MSDKKEESFEEFFHEYFEGRESKSPTFSWKHILFDFWNRRQRKIDEQAEDIDNLKKHCKWQSEVLGKSAKSLGKKIGEIAKMREEIRNLETAYNGLKILTKMRDEQIADFKKAFNSQTERIKNLTEEYKLFYKSFDDFFEFMQEYCQDPRYVGRTHQENAVSVIKSQAKRLERAEKLIKYCAKPELNSDKMIACEKYLKEMEGEKSKNKRYFHFSNLTEEEKERLEHERKARAKREGRELLDGVICVRSKDEDCKKKNLDSRFEALSQLVWDHFLAKDSNGNTGKDRNKEETAEHWNKYHEITSGKK